MKKTIEFQVTMHTEFGIGWDKRKAKLEIGDVEGTFKNILKSLPQRIAKSWILIEFEFEGDHFDIGKSDLHETNFDFWESVRVGAGV